MHTRLVLVFLVLAGCELDIGDLFDTSDTARTGLTATDDPAPLPYHYVRIRDQTDGDSGPADDEARGSSEEHTAGRSVRRTTSDRRRDRRRRSRRHRRRRRSHRAGHRRRRRRDGGARWPR